MFYIFVKLCLYLNLNVFQQQFSYYVILLMLKWYLNEHWLLLFINENIFFFPGIDKIGLFKIVSVNLKIWWVIFNSNNSLQ